MNTKDDIYKFIDKYIKEQTKCKRAIPDLAKENWFDTCFYAICHVFKVEEIISMTDKEFDILITFARKIGL